MPCLLLLLLLLACSPDLTPCQWYDFRAPCPLKPTVGLSNAGVIAGKRR